MLTHIRGDTFSLAGEVTVTVNGTRQLDLSGWTAASQVRDSLDNLIAELTFAWVDAAQSLISLTAAGSTANWPLGQIYTDIQFTSPNGDIVSTQRTSFTVARDVTHVS
jgi:hypothetical protein